ncbi:hypothetical protein INT48_006382 [Thamnidium elegans]|uniref:Retrotransposon gag domain-containing protein n=1 Tax=Thamnidium elegans TaxID=101142 RepID=A0A8H7SMB0_9FUNG|nr:hypothetical protein INT48_006382 [Thamnidium elegans]
MSLQMFQLPKFKRKDGPELWLFRYNKMANLNQWSVDIKLNYVDNCFDSKMQLWFMQQNFKNWNQFKNAFIYKYAKKVNLDKIFVDIINFKMAKSETVDDYIDRFENKRMQFNREIIKNQVQEVETPVRFTNKEKATTSTNNQKAETKSEQNVNLKNEDAGLAISENGFIKFFTKGLYPKGLRRYLKVEKPQTLDKAYELLRDLCDSDDETSSDETDYEHQGEK